MNQGWLSVITARSDSDLQRNNLDWLFSSKLIVSLTVLTASKERWCGWIIRMKGNEGNVLARQWSTQLVIKMFCVRIPLCTIKERWMWNSGRANASLSRGSVFKSRWELAFFLRQIYSVVCPWMLVCAAWYRTSWKSKKWEKEIMEIDEGSLWRGWRIKALVSKVIESSPIGSLASSQFDEWRPNLKFVDLRSTNFKGTLPIKNVILKEKSWAPNSGI